MARLEVFSQGLNRAPSCDFESFMPEVLDMSDSACFSLSAAAAQYDMACAQYEDSFSAVRRSLGTLDAGATAYRKKHLEPLQEQWQAAKSLLAKATLLKERVEEGAAACSSESSSTCSARSLPCGCKPDLLSLAKWPHAHYS